MTRIAAPRGRCRWPVHLKSGEVDWRDSALSLLGRQPASANVALDRGVLGLKAFATSTGDRNRARVASPIR